MDGLVALRKSSFVRTLPDSFALQRLPTPLLRNALLLSSDWVVASPELSNYKPSSLLTIEKNASITALS